MLEKWNDTQIKVLLKLADNPQRTQLYTKAKRELERRGYRVVGTTVAKTHPVAVVSGTATAEIAGDTSSFKEAIDLVNSPPHYTHGPIEVIDLIEMFNLDYREGNALKYLLRWRHKGGTESLEKAIWYIKRIIAHEQEGPGSTAPGGIKEELSGARRLSGEDSGTDSAVKPAYGHLSGPGIDLGASPGGSHIRHPRT
jgi:hypothetical protein